MRQHHFLFIGFIILLVPSLYGAYWSFNYEKIHHKCKWYLSSGGSVVTQTIYPPVLNNGDKIDSMKKLD